MLPHGSLPLRRRLGEPWGGKGPGGGGGGPAALPRGFSLHTFLRIPSGLLLLPAACSNPNTFTFLTYLLAAPPSLSVSRSPPL